MAAIGAAIVYHEGGHGILDDHDQGHHHDHEKGKGRGPKLIAVAVVVVAVSAFYVLRMM